MLVRNLLFRFFFFDVFVIRFVMFINFIVVGRMCLGLIIVVKVFRCGFGIGIMFVFGLIV